MQIFFIREVRDNVYEVGTMSYKDQIKYWRYQH